MRKLSIPLLLTLLSLLAGGHATAQVAPPPTGVDTALGAARNDDSRTLLELEKLRAERQGARRTQCDRLRLRVKRAGDDLARARGRAGARAQQRLRRTRQMLAVECPA